MSAIEPKSPLNQSGQKIFKALSSEPVSLTQQVKSPKTKLAPSTPKRETLAQVAMESMADLGLDKEENRVAVLKAQQNYNENENVSLFTTIALFAKKHLLSQSSFNFLKNSMNVITQLSGLMDALDSIGLLNGSNLKSLMNMPVLKELSALFSLISLSDEKKLNQTTFDEVVSTAEPITTQMARDIQQDTRSVSVTEALLRCTANQVNSEEILEQVKAHPFPQRMAKAVIDIKQRGLKFTENMMNRLVESDTPDELLDGVVNYVSTGKGNQSSNDMISSVATLASRGLSAAMSFFYENSGTPKASSEPKPAELSPVKVDKDEQESTSDLTII